MPKSDPKQSSFRNPVSIVDLRRLAEYSKARDKDPRLTFSNFARSRKQNPTTFHAAFQRVENEADTLVTEFVQLEPSSKKHLPAKAVFPEQLSEVVKRQSELTLDGKIWSEFARLVLQYYELTLAATRPIPSPSPAVEAARRKLGVPKFKTQNRRSEFDRERFLEWLQHQNARLDQELKRADAHDMSIFELIFLTDPQMLEAWRRAQSFGCNPEAPEPEQRQEA